MKKRIFLLLMAVIMLVGSGCSTVLYSGKSKQYEGIRYLEKKYGEKGAYSVRDAYKESKRYNMYIAVKGHEDWDLRLTWYFDEKCYKDNYMSWYLKEEAEEKFQGILNEVFGECKLYYSPYGAQETEIFTKETKIEEYLEKVNGNSIDVFVKRNTQNAEADLENLKKTFLDRKGKYNVEVFYISDEIYEKISNENVEADAGQYVHRMTQFYKKANIWIEDGQEISLNWRDGNLS